MELGLGNPRGRVEGSRLKLRTPSYTWGPEQGNGESGWGRRRRELKETGNNYRPESQEAPHSAVPSPKLSKFPSLGYWDGREPGRTSQSWIPFLPLGELSDAFTLCMGLTRCLQELQGPVDGVGHPGVADPGGQLTTSHPHLQHDIGHQNQADMRTLSVSN